MENSGFKTSMSSRFRMNRTKVVFLQAYIRSRRVRRIKLVRETFSPSRRRCKCSWTGGRGRNPFPRFRSLQRSWWSIIVLIFALTSSSGTKFIFFSVNFPTLKKGKWRKNFSPFLDKKYLILCKCWYFCSRSAHT